MPFDKDGNWTPTNNSPTGQGYNPDTNVGAGFDAYSANVYKPYAGNFSNPGDAENHQNLYNYFNMLGGRSAPQMTAASTGAAAMSPAAYAGPGATWGGASIDTTNSDSDRAAQAALLSQLQAESAGKGPSLATETMKQGLAANLQQQAALAGSMGGGGNPALAMRNLQYGAASQNQQLLGQAGLARLQEQMAAQQQLGSVASGMRGQDIGLAAQQAGLAQQTGMFNAQQQNQFSLANAGFTQQSNLANQAAQNQFELQNAQWQQQAGLANQQSDLGLMGLNQQGQTWALGQNIGMSEADRQAAIQYEQLMQSGSIAQQQIGAQAYGQAAGARRALIGGVMSGLGGAMMSDEDQKMDVADESSAYDDPMSRTNDSGGKDYAAARAGNFFSGMGASLSGTSPTFAKTPSVFGGDASTPSPGGEPDISQVVQGERQSFADRLANEQQMLMSRNSPEPSGGDSGGGMGGMGGMLGGMMSDERQKTNVTAQGASAKLLDPLTPYSYEYKDPTLPGTEPGRHLGVMAQDLEKTVFGERSVADTPNGKMVDYSKLAPAHLAASADMHRRLSVVESMLGMGPKNEGDEKTNTSEKPSEGAAEGSKTSAKKKKKGKA